MPFFVDFDIASRTSDEKRLAIHAWIRALPDWA